VAFGEDPSTDLIVQAEVQNIPSWPGMEARQKERHADKQAGFGRAFRAG